MVLHRSAKADPSGYPGSIPGVGVSRIEQFDLSIFASDKINSDKYF
jgi:hypothetical protein